MVGGPARQRRPVERESGRPDFTSLSILSPSTGGSQPAAHTGRPPGHGAGAERQRTQNAAPNRIRFREHISDTRPQTRVRSLPTSGSIADGEPLHRRYFKRLINVLPCGREEVLFSYLAFGLFPGFGRGSAAETPTSSPLYGETCQLLPP